MRDGKNFKNVLEPSLEHYFIFNKAKSIEFSGVEYVKVASLEYGLVYTIDTPSPIKK